MLSALVVRFEQGGGAEGRSSIRLGSKGSGRGRAEGDTKLLLEEYVGEGCRPQAKEPWF